MSLLETLDRVAISAMLLAAAAIPLASVAVSFSWPPESPSATVPLAGGGQRQFFTSGPLGTTTYRVDLDAAGREVAREQVLRDEMFQRIRPGMRAADVLALIGPPAAKVRFDATRLTAWDYHYLDAWGHTADLSVMVDDAGVVASRFTALEGD